MSIIRSFNSLMKRNVRGRTFKINRRKGPNWNDLSENYPPVKTNEILLGTTDYRDLFMTKFLNNRVMNKQQTIIEEMSVRGNHKDVLKFVKEKFKDNMVFTHQSNSLLVDLSDSIIEIYSNSNIQAFKFVGTFDSNEKHRKMVKEHFEEISVYVNWIYDSHMSSVRVPVDSTLSPVDEMYPFLDGETLESYYDRFMKSSASILILIGPPGVGKTTFCRGFLTSTESSANVTYDEKLLSNDGLFSDFIESNSNVLVIEDADLFLAPRKDGNDMMHRFLNVSDGLVSVKGKKIIFSTNLPNTKDIDPALMRKGRCFEVVHFDLLNTDQAMTLAKKLNITYNPEVSKTTHSIAEITNNEDTGSVNFKVGKKFGFSNGM